MRGLLVFALALTACGSVRGENWPQWRGPRGTGQSGERRLPIAWSEASGVAWKCPVPPGASSPIVWGDAVFVTGQEADGSLLALRVDRRTGDVVWRKKIGSAATPREAPKRRRQKFHELHNLASPTPATDGRRVVVHYGNGELAALDFDGAVLWQRNLVQDYGPYNIWWGHANSPVIHQGSVISVCMQDPLDGVSPQPSPSYVVAHDLRDGHVRWQVDRRTEASAEQGDSYTTPLLLQSEGNPELVVMGANVMDAYDPRDGRQLWQLPGLHGGRTVTGMTADDERIYATRGMRGPTLAVRRGGSGELTSRAIDWQFSRGTPDSCSPAVWQRLLFWVSDEGVARCLESDGGHVRWTERLPGSYKASPLVADGRLYFLNTEGLCTVVSATRRFNKLLQNQLDDRTLASPAASQGFLYLRGDSFLYCIGPKAALLEP